MFQRSIDEWAQRTEKLLDNIYGRAIELLAEEATKTIPQGGKVPFLTGALSRSLLASKTGMPDASGVPVGIVTVDIKAHETVWIGYTVNYARRMEYGFVGADSLGRVYDFAGYHFLTDASSKWDDLVKRAANEFGD